MRFEDLNWMDIERYLDKEDRLMIVIGACEQHGYLSLLSDVKIPLALADSASEQTGVLIAPPVNFGSSPYFLSYPGTISLRITTLLDLVEDIVRSVYGYGFRRILFLNGHGGNEAVRNRLFELSNLFDDINLRWYSWWQSHSVEELALKYELKLSHANWLEAFPFTVVSDLPAGEKNPPTVPGLIGAVEARNVYRDGVFGGKYKVDDKIMNEMFQVALDDILVLLQFE
jgi:creatinine amidohydrolase